MRVYFDVFSNDEMLSDSYRITPLYDGAVLEVPASWIDKGGEQIDIGRSDHFAQQGEGAERDEEEKVEDTSERVLDIKEKFQLNEVPFTKKEYATYIKAYMPKLRKHLEATSPERVEGFMKGASDFVKFMMGKFSEFKFYNGSSYDTEAMCVLSYYKEETDDAPTFLFFADGLRGQEY